MKLLILGGTAFVGRHLVEAALAGGHAVTLFNRGRHDPGLFPQVEHLRGNRDGDLTALRGRRWDAAIDTSGFLPRTVHASAEALADAVEHYTFVSTLSVYGQFRRPGATEATPVATLTEAQVREVETLSQAERTVGGGSFGELYGPLKALCEQAAEAVMPGRVLNVRAGLIVGPYDYTDRFTYWVGRVARGGDVLAPDAPDRPTQFVDARDLADWIIGSAGRRLAGTFNVTGPDQPLTLGELLDTCRAVAGSDARFVWADEAFLLEQGVRPWIELPLWLPGQAGRDFQQVNCQRAIAAGLTFRPLAETVRATLTWDRSRPAEEPRRAGMAPERERELLARLAA